MKYAVFTYTGYMQVYAASRGQEQLRVYNLHYKDSFEQDKYAASLRREQSIFEELIRAKGHMVLPDLQQVRLTTLEPVKIELQRVTHSARSTVACLALVTGPGERYTQR